MDHMNAETEHRILEILRKADRGEGEVVNLTGKSFEDDYCGVMRFKVSTDGDSVEIGVFNDCWEWDYIQEVMYKGVLYKSHMFMKEEEPPKFPAMTTALVHWYPRDPHDDRWGEYGDHGGHDWRLW